MYHWLHAQRAPVVITAAAPVAASQQLSRVSDSVVAEGRHSVSTDTSAPRHAPVRQPPPRPATVPSPQSGECACVNARVRACEYVLVIDDNDAECASRCRCN
jgi:hypothetical protein